MHGYLSDIDADGILHVSTRKLLDEHGGKLDGGERERIGAAIASLEQALKGSDKAAIDAALGALSTAAQALGQKLYADQQAAPPQGETARQGGGPGDAHADDIVDADFKEVKRG